MVDGEEIKDDLDDEEEINKPRQVSVSFKTLSEEVSFM